MSQEVSVTQPSARDRDDHVFPTLSGDQIERISAHGQRRRVEAGEALGEAGDPNVRCFVVLTARLEIVQRDGPAEHLVTSPGPGQFTGEANMISGGRALL